MRSSIAGRIHDHQRPARGIAMRRRAGTTRLQPHPTRGNTAMNWDRIEGNWKQFTGNIKQQWARLTDDQLDVIAGKRDQLVGKIQETYGITREEAEKQGIAWQTRLKEAMTPK